MQNHSERLGVEAFFEDRDMDRGREHEKISQGSSGVLKTRAVFDHTNVLMTKNIGVFLRLTGVQVYQVAIRHVLVPPPKV